jgi:hypothetical protein
MKRLFLSIGIVVVVLAAILLGINAYYVATTGARLEAQLAELRAAGDPIALKDLARPPIPPEKNAATYLQRASHDLQAFQKEWYAIFPNSEHLTDPLTPAQLARAQKVVDAYPNIVPLLEQAAACPDYDPQYDFTISGSAFLDRALKHIGDHRTVDRTLRARATVLLAIGRRDEAMSNMVLLLRLCRHIDREPMTIGYLMSLACRGAAVAGANAVLQSGTVSGQSRESLERELAQWDGVQAFREALKSERAYGLDSCREMPWARFWLGGRAMDYAGQSAYLDVIREYQEAASRPFTDLKPAQPVDKRRTWFTAPYVVLIDLLRPSLDATRSAMERTCAMVRAVRVLNAIQAKVAPDAKEPPKLSELGLPPDAIIDPFNGQPLHVKKLPKGWIVYSVGPNGIDDGGIIDFKSDVGIGPPGSEPKAEKK